MHHLASLFRPRRALSTAVIALACAAPAAHAQGVYMPASACQLRNGAGSEFIRHSQVDLLTVGEKPLPVICPVPRLTAAGLRVRIIGSVSLNQTMVCTLESMGIDGNLIVRSFSVKGTSAYADTKFARELGLSEADAASYSFQNVQCTLPALRGGTLRGYVVLPH